MSTYLYTKHQPKNVKKLFRIFGIVLIVMGFLFGLYTLSPLLSWELYLKPVYASSNFASPIPQTTILTQETLKSLLANSIRGNTWLPSATQLEAKSTTSLYQLNIPKIEINNAIVSTTDTDISQHLVHFPGTAFPPEKGNAVIFGHSTLPQLYDPKNYKTIFANIHSLTLDDKLMIKINNMTYTYKIVKITILDAEDTSYLTQDHDDSYVTIVTCTPPGTTWKRLILKARLEKV